MSLYGKTTVKPARNCVIYISVISGFAGYEMPAAVIA